MNIRTRFFVVWVTLAAAGCVEPEVVSDDDAGAGPEDTSESSDSAQDVATDSGQKGSDDDTLPAELPDSMKGYELYSWEINGTWHFTLVTGTNRNKTEDEIIAEENTISGDGFVKITVAGEEALLDLLSRLPPESDILWCTSDSPQVEDSAKFTLPDEEMVDRIGAFCLEHSINLSQ
jgi:hypothetical protein